MNRHVVQTSNVARFLATAEQKNSTGPTALNSAQAAGSRKRECMACALTVDAMQMAMVAMEMVSSSAWWTTWPAMSVNFSLTRSEKWVWKEGRGGGSQGSVLVGHRDSFGSVI